MLMEDSTMNDRQLFQLLNDVNANIQFIQWHIPRQAKDIRQFFEVHVKIQLPYDPLQLPKNGKFMGNH